MNGSVKPRKLSIGLRLCILLLFLLTACSDAPPHAAEEPGRVNQEQNANTDSAAANAKWMSIGITRAPGSFNPLDRPDWSSFRISSVLFPPLMELDEDLTFVPMLADRVETKDNQTFTVHLNPKAKWTDGNPVTAEDVMFSLEMIMHPNLSSIMSSQFSPLEGLDSQGKFSGGAIADFPGAQIIDEFTVQFRMKSPVDPVVFYEKIAANLKAVPKHILEGVDPDKLTQHPFMFNPSVSYGPFRFVSYQKNQYVELGANPDYFKGAPKINKLYFKIMPASNLAAQLQSGEIHMNFPEIGAIELWDYERVKNLSNVRTIEGKPVNWKFVGVNARKLDVTIKQAFAYGMNRTMIVESLFKGSGEIANGPFPSIHPYFNDKFKDAYPYDPQKAKRMLQDAGWDPNRVLDFIVPTGQGFEPVADVLIQNLKDIGVEARMQKLDTPAAVAKIIKGDYDLFMLNMGFLLDPDRAFIYQTGATNNFTGYSNPEMDRLLQEGLMTTDPQERKAIYTRFSELFMRDLPEIPLYADYRLRAVSKSVKVGEPKDIGMLIHVHEWDIEN